MKLEYTVKEIASITGVSARTLRYYDSIDLFKPTGTHSNGYRYYTLDKIEEIHFISYLRHVGVPIKEIRSHLSNRDMSKYESILQGQLKKIQEEILQMQRIEKRIQRRIQSLEYIRNLPPIGEIHIQDLKARHILELKRPLMKEADWEFTLSQIEAEYDLPPSIFIGDLGFYVDLNQVKTRGPEEFTGFFLLADDAYYVHAKKRRTLPAGRWLTLYIKGNHTDASREYTRLIEYAQSNGLRLDAYAIERTILDHYISSDPDYYITEIQIPIIPS
jgi:DNA-binding transcriptional MerR regulator